MSLFANTMRENTDEQLLLRWFKADRKQDTLTNCEAENLYNIFKELGFKKITDLQTVQWDTIENTSIEEKFYPWLSAWLPRKYTEAIPIIEGVWEDSFKGRKCTITRCLDDYMDKVKAPEDKEELKEWWEGCPACNAGGSDPHMYAHPACSKNSYSDGFNKTVFTKMKKMKDEKYTIYYVMDKFGYKNKAVLTQLHSNPTKITLTAPWGKNKTLRKWEGEICDNQTKIVWNGRHGTSFWYKMG